MVLRFATFIVFSKFDDAVPYANQIKWGLPMIASRGLFLAARPLLLPAVAWSICLLSVCKERSNSSVKARLAPDPNCKKH